MKRNLYFCLFFAVIVLCSCTKPAGQLITKSLDVEGCYTYTSLDVSDAFDVYVSDTAHTVYVTAGENIMPKIVVKIVDNTLKIYCDKININTQEMKVIIPHSAELNSVELSGASTFQSPFSIENNEVFIRMSGASNMFGDIVSNRVSMDLSGSSYLEGNYAAAATYMELSGASGVKLSGHTGKLNLVLSGGSYIQKNISGNQYAFSCDECEATLSGASKAYIHCTTSIKANLSGGSGLHYTGDASTDGSTTTGGSYIIYDVL
ncbi:MAG: DUF2807 domain-containing protein [Bacteroidales bacterium]|nr:DUF2807 domain-containing protein [Bacteroidales bacterium]